MATRMYGVSHLTCGILRFTAVGCLLWLAIPISATAKLNISGVDKTIEKNIRIFVELEGEPCDAEPWVIRRRFQSMEEQTAKALEAFGFYTPSFSKELTWTEKCWTADLVVDLGVPVTLKEVDIEIFGQAATEAAFTELTASKTLVRGEALQHKAYENTKDRLRTLAADLGYFDAEFLIAKIDVWPDRHTAAVTLHFDSGNRYKIGDITIKQDFLDSELVEKQIDLTTGTPYATEELAKVQQQLSASGYFSQVSVQPDITARTDEKVPVEITLSPGQRLNYTVGGGFSTDTGVRFRSGYENRRVNRRGHQFSGDLLVSNVLSELSTTYRRPLGRPDTEWISYSAGIQFEDTDTSESDRFSLGLRRATLLGADWIRSDALSLQLDQFTVGTDRDNSRLLMPSIGLSQKRADQLVNPSRGHSLNFEVRGASDVLGSTTSFLQFTGSGRLVRSLGDKGRLLLRANLGATIESDLDELPPAVRFFAGGTDSVRGFGFENLGPTDSAGLVIGGSNLLTTSVEYDRLFLPNFAYAFFVDAGNAFDGTDINPRVGAGLGLKWRSPIGPVRVYVAHPVNFSDRSFRLHVSIGPDL